jgi:hypothetical protein
LTGPACVFTKVHIISIDDVDALDKFKIALIAVGTVVADCDRDITLFLLGVERSSDVGFVLLEKVGGNRVNTLLNLTNLHLHFLA